MLSIAPMIFTSISTAYTMYCAVGVVRRVGEWCEKGSCREGTGCYRGVRLAWYFLAMADNVFPVVAIVTMSKAESEEDRIKVYNVGKTLWYVTLAAIVSEFCFSLWGLFLGCPFLRATIRIDKACSVSPSRQTATTEVNQDNSSLAIYNLPDEIVEEQTIRGARPPPNPVSYRPPPMLTINKKAVNSTPFKKRKRIGRSNTNTSDKRQTNKSSVSNIPIQEERESEHE